MSLTSTWTRSCAALALGLGCPVPASAQATGYQVLVQYRTQWEEVADPYGTPVE